MVFNIEQWVSQFSNAGLACQFGVLIGVLHHFAIQTPRQADIFTTLFTYAEGNAVYLAAWLLPKNVVVANIVHGVPFFNLTYVPTFCVPSDVDFHCIYSQNCLQRLLPAPWYSCQILNG